MGCEGTAQEFVRGREKSSAGGVRGRLRGELTLPGEVHEVRHMAHLALVRAVASACASLRDRPPADPLLGPVDDVNEEVQSIYCTHC